MTRRLRLEAIREADAAARAFAESDIGKERRETGRRFSESDVCRKLRESAAGLDFDRLRAGVSAAGGATKEMKEAILSLTEDGPNEPAREPTPRARRKGGRPRDHDWEGAKNALADWTAANGRPDVKQRLIEVAQDWFKKIDGGAPNDRDIRRILVDPLYS
jgi:hypothetical protein